MSADRPDRVWNVTPVKPPETKRHAVIEGPPRRRTADAWLCFACVVVAVACLLAAAAIVAGAILR